MSWNSQGPSLAESDSSAKYYYLPLFLMRQILSREIWTRTSCPQNFFKKIALDEQITSSITIGLDTPREGKP